MFTIHDFKSVCRILAIYTSNLITPMEVMEKLRKFKNKEKEIASLSLAFETIPGYSNFVIQDFIDILRGKVVVQ